MCLWCSLTFFVSAVILKPQALFVLYIESLNGESELQCAVVSLRFQLIQSATVPAVPDAQRGHAVKSC